MTARSFQPHLPIYQLSHRAKRPSAQCVLFIGALAGTAVRVRTWFTWLVCSWRTATLGTREEHLGRFIPSSVSSFDILPRTLYSTQAYTELVQQAAGKCVTCTIFCPRVRRQNVPRRKEWLQTYKAGLRTRHGRRWPIFLMFLSSTTLVSLLVAGCNNEMSTVCINRGKEWNVSLHMEAFWLNKQGLAKLRADPIASPDEDTQKGDLVEDAKKIGYIVNGHFVSTDLWREVAVFQNRIFFTQKGDTGKAASGTSIIMIFIYVPPTCSISGLYTQVPEANSALHFRSLPGMLNDLVIDHFLASLPIACTVKNWKRMEEYRLTEL